MVLFITFSMCKPPSRISVFGKYKNVIVANKLGLYFYYGCETLSLKDGNINN